MRGGDPADMRFVPVKSTEQQAALSLHRTRNLLVRQRTQLVNIIRGLLAEFGVAFPKGVEQALALARRVAAGETQELPALAAGVVRALAEQVLQGQEARSQARSGAPGLASLQRARPAHRHPVPGVGLIGATALAASVTDPTQFRSGRQFAAWLGLIPLQHSSGGKERLGRISKMGDQYLRRLLISGMTSLVRRNLHHPGRADPKIDACSRASRCEWRPSSWPTGRPGRSGPSWCAEKATELPSRSPPPDYQRQPHRSAPREGARFRGCEDDVK